MLPGKSVFKALEFKNYWIGEIEKKKKNYPRSATSGSFIHPNKFKREKYLGNNLLLQE
jgi:hypothetical protein